MFTKVHQQTKCIIGSTQIVVSLCFMHVMYFFESLQFNNNLIITHKIGKVFLFQ